MAVYLKLNYNCISCRVFFLFLYRLSVRFIILNPPWYGNESFIETPSPKKLSTLNLNNNGIEICQIFITKKLLWKEAGLLWKMFFVVLISWWWFDCKCIYSKNSTAWLDLTCRTWVTLKCTGLLYQFQLSVAAPDFG